MSYKLAKPGKLSHRGLCDPGLSGFRIHPPPVAFGWGSNGGASPEEPLPSAAPRTRGPSENAPWRRTEGPARKGRASKNVSDPIESCQCSHFRHDRWGKIVDLGSLRDPLARIHPASGLTNFECLGFGEFCSRNRRFSNLSDVFSDQTDVLGSSFGSPVFEGGIGLQP